MIGGIKIIQRNLRLSKPNNFRRILSDQFRRFRYKIKLFFGTFPFRSLRTADVFPVLASPSRNIWKMRLFTTGYPFLRSHLFSILFLRYYSHLHLSFPLLLTVAFLSCARFVFWSNIVWCLRMRLGGWAIEGFQGWWTFYVRWRIHEETHVNL